ncbi:MAG TPA: ABC transporter permease [Stellaceae bacterium]|jgi:phospholipid/cholesterol/gamma-HCH transport system permease protein|nr:ABC transporter permease [Stellaceae bacterium]
MRPLAVIGAAVRAQSRFGLQLAALLWGVLREGVWPSIWRRTVRASFRTTLSRTVGGSLGTIAVTAVIAGLALVFEAIYWLRTAGQQGQIGHILVIVLFREITPLLVGIILLGRGGTATVAELGMMTAEGEIAILRAEGIDIFQYMVLPRAVAFALAGFTLGMVFVVISLITGFITGSLAGVVNTSIFGFLDNVLRAMTIADFAIFPAKLLLIGLVVALACCMTGLNARAADTPASLLPRGFTRGMTGILTVTLILSAII